MRSTTFGELRAIVAGGDDGDGRGDGPVVVLLHGFGAPGNDLVSLWRVLRVHRSTRFVFPEAPLALGSEYGSGRAWWNIDIERFARATQTGRVDELIRETPAGLDQARIKVEGFLDEVEHLLKVSGEQMVLGGFSQGAMLSCDVVLRTDRPFAGLVMFSGTFLAEVEWTERMPRRKSLPVFQSHGYVDPLLPFSVAERLRDRLRGSGLRVSWTEFRGGHAIGDEVIGNAGAWLLETIGRP